MSSEAANTEPKPNPIFDPGWLFLAAGLALLGVTVIIPAVEEVAEARFKRDQVLAVEKHREERMARYEEFIGALDSREPSLVISLAESQLNQIPTDRGALPFGTVGGTNDASVFPSLEPEPLVLPTREKDPSRLERLTTDEKFRPWVMIGGAVCVLIGLLPGTRKA